MSNINTGTTNIPIPDSPIARMQKVIQLTRHTKWQNRQPLDVMPMPKEEEKREIKAGAIMVSLLASLDMFIYDFIEQLEAAGKYRFGNKRIVNKARDIIIHAHMKFWNNIYGIYRDCSDYNNKMDEFYRQIDECVGLHDESLARAYSIVVAICRLQAEYRKKLVAHTYLPSFEVEKIPAMLEGLGIHDYNLDNIIERRVRPIVMNAEYIG